MLAHRHFGGAIQVIAAGDFAVINAESCDTADEAGTARLAYAALVVAVFDLGFVTMSHYAASVGLGDGVAVDRTRVVAVMDDG